MTLEKSKDLEYELIALSYSAAEDAGLSPRALQGLAESLTYVSAERSTTDLNSGLRPSEGELFTLVSRLLPHVQRAKRISANNDKLRGERDAACAVLQRLPFAIILLNPMGKVLLLNAKAQVLLKSDLGLIYQNGSLVASDPQDDAKLSKLISDVSSLDHRARSGGVVQLQIRGQMEQAQPITLLIVPAKPEQGGVLDASAAIFISNSESQPNISADVIASVFSLTPAEARLTQALVCGKSLEQAAFSLGISLHTVRSSLKNIFSKTDTHRQAELVYRVLLSPAVIGGNVTPQSTLTPCYRSGAHTEYFREGNVKLRDGRIVGYGEYGRLEDDVIIFCPALLGSRLGAPLEADQMAELGLRFIVVERPGYGLSSAKPGQSILEWASDLEQLADALNIARFSLVGQSCGAAFAAAAAFRLGSRVKCLGLVGGMTPFARPSCLAGMVNYSRIVLLLARYMPATIPVLSSIYVREIKREPQRFLKQLLAQSSPTDLLIMSDEHYTKRMIQAVHEAVKNGADGFINDLLQISQPWHFELENIKTDVQFWHGEIDDQVPISLARQFERIPNSQAHYIRNEGHFLIAHWPKILHSLREFPAKK